MEYDTCKGDSISASDSCRSSEELESADKRLQTANYDLQQWNDSLAQTDDDLNNLLKNIDIPILVLTSDLRIQQFTQPMQNLLSVRPIDIGRPITEIRLQLSLNEIEPILFEVLKTSQSREVEVQDRRGRWHLLRVRPYRTPGEKVEGLILLLFDIDQLRKSQQLVVDAMDFANSVVESVPVPIAILNQDFTIRAENTAFRQVTQLPSIGVVGRPLQDVVSSVWGPNEIGEKLQELLDAPLGSTAEFEFTSARLPRKNLQLRGRALSHQGKRTLLVILHDETIRSDAALLASTQADALKDEIQLAALKLSHSQGELRGLTAHLFTLQEDERQRIARELHDDVSQRLSLLGMLLHEIDIEENGDEGQRKLKIARDQLQEINTSVRQLSHQLHPSLIEDLGISTALKTLVTEFGERENMPATYISQDLPEELASRTGVTIYRIAQEALRNVAKHAGKTHVKVSLKGKDNFVQLKVRDFGVGFDQESESQARGLGMISMQERARMAGGQLRVSSTLGEGTEIIAELPLEPYA